MNSDGPHRLCCLILTTGDDPALSRTLESAAFADQRVIAVSSKFPLLSDAIDPAVPVVRYDEATAVITSLWTLILFSGDSITPALAAECRSVCGKESQHNTVALSIESYFLNHRMCHSGLSPHRETRLIRTELVRDFLIAQNGNTGIMQSSVVLRAPLICHRAFSLQMLIAHLNDATSLEAGEVVREENRLGSRRPTIVLVPFREFIRIYIDKQGFRDGVYGFLCAAYASVRALAMEAKKWEYARALAAKTELPPATADDLLNVKRLG